MSDKLQKGVDSTDSLTAEEIYMSDAIRELEQEIGQEAYDKGYEDGCKSTSHSSRDADFLELTSRVAVAEGANVELEAENKKLIEALEMVIDEIDSDYQGIISNCRNALGRGES